MPARGNSWQPIGYYPDVPGLRSDLDALRTWQNPLRFNSDFFPSVTGRYSLGEPTHQWKGIHARSIRIGTETTAFFEIGETGVLSSTLTLNIPITFGACLSFGSSGGFRLPRRAALPSSGSCSGIGAMFSDTDDNSLGYNLAGSAVVLFRQATGSSDASSGIAGLWRFDNNAIPTVSLATTNGGTTIGSFSQAQVAFGTAAGTQSGTAAFHFDPAAGSNQRMTLASNFELWPRGGTTGHSGNLSPLQGTNNNELGTQNFRWRSISLQQGTVATGAINIDTDVAADVVMRWRTTTTPNDFIIEVPTGRDMTLLISTASPTNAYFNVQSHCRPNTDPGDAPAGAPCDLGTVASQNSHTISKRWRDLFLRGTRIFNDVATSFSLDLSNASNTTFFVTNGGAGVASLSVDATATAVTVDASTQVRTPSIITPPTNTDLTITPNGTGQVNVVSALNSQTSINTGAGDGTARIDSSGNLVNIGSITMTGTISAVTTLTVTTITTPASTRMTLTSLEPATGGADIGFIVDANNLGVVTADKLVSFRTANTERAYFRADGAVFAGITGTTNASLQVVATVPAFVSSIALIAIASNAGAGGGTLLILDTTSVTGALSATGNINSSGGVLQTNGTTRITNAGAANNLIFDGGAASNKLLLKNSATPATTMEITATETIVGSNAEIYVLINGTTYKFQGLP